MTKLTKFQIDLLTAAAVSDDDAVERPEENPKATAALIKQGLMISLPRVEGPSRLLITSAGRTAVGIAPLDRTKQEDPEPDKGTASRSAEDQPSGKIGAVIGLLRRAEGATIEELMGATGWQAHSVRGAISGSLKKKLSLGVISEKVEGVRRYRIQSEEA